MNYIPTNALKTGMLAGLQIFGGGMKTHIHKHCIIGTRWLHLSEKQVLYSLFSLSFILIQLYLVTLLALMISVGLNCRRL